MIEGKGGILAIVAILIAAGGFSYLIYQDAQGNLNGSDGDDGEDGEDTLAVGTIHYCGTVTEVQNAINTIGAGSGTIIITQNIAISTAITVDKGGRYVIEGMGGCTLTPSAGVRAIDVTDAKTCTIKDLIIDASLITYFSDSLIDIAEINDNPVIVQNVQIFGDGDQYSQGIKVMSDHVLIESCRFENIYRGVHLHSVLKCHVLGCMFKGLSEYGIYLSAGYSHVIDGNSIEDVHTGIYLTNEYNAISNNNIRNVSRCGIVLESAFGNSITGNVIYNDNSISDANELYGIHILTYSDYNTVTGNNIIDINNGGSGVGHGMTIETTCDQNVVVGNNLYDNDDNIINDNGLNNIVENNYGT